MFQLTNTDSLLLFDRFVHSCIWKIFLWPRLDVCWPWDYFPSHNIRECQESGVNFFPQISKASPEAFRSFHWPADQSKTIINFWVYCQSLFEWFNSISLIYWYLSRWWIIKLWTMELYGSFGMSQFSGFVLDIRSDNKIIWSFFCAVSNGQFRTAIEPVAFCGPKKKTFEESFTSWVRKTPEFD